jgi:hypothetical protein
MFVVSQSCSRGALMQQKHARILGFAGTLLLLGAVSAQTTGYDVAFPTG